MRATNQVPLTLNVTDQLDRRLSDRSYSGPTDLIPTEQGSRKDAILTEREVVRHSARPPDGNDSSRLTTQRP